MDFFDAVTTQRAIRRLKPEPIPDVMLRQIMDAAICAPSGGYGGSDERQAGVHPDPTYRAGAMVLRIQNAWPQRSACATSASGRRGGRPNFPSG